MSPAPGPKGRIAFVESKVPDFDRMKTILNVSERHNMWSNRGPVWRTLAEVAVEVAGLPDDLVALPCANGGIALEALAQMHAYRAGRPLTWAVSAFSFANTGRGLFANALHVDCDERGLLSLSDLEDRNIRDVDGIIVTNVFGVYDDFSDYSAWAEKHGKLLILDNAAGFFPGMACQPYQAISLHQTKPFGMGEGGLVIVPRAEMEEILLLLEYTPIGGEAPYWVANGKVSDLSCAAQLVRLETSASWIPLYMEQTHRIRRICEDEGCQVLGRENAVAMSLPVIFPGEVSIEDAENPNFTVGKYYRPLSSLPIADDLYRRVLNIPSHPDMSQIPDQVLRGLVQSIASETAA